MKTSSRILAPIASFLAAPFVMRLLVFIVDKYGWVPFACILLCATFLILRACGLFKKKGGGAMSRYDFTDASDFLVGAGITPEELYDEVQDNIKEIEP